MLGSNIPFEALERYIAVVNIALKCKLLIIY